MLGSGGLYMMILLCIVRNTWNFSRFITMSLADNVHLVARDRMVRKVLHRIETGFGREEDIVVEYQSKLKETQFVH
jgi:hypothetical protein